MEKTAGVRRRTFLKLLTVGGLTALVGGGALLPSFRRAVQNVLQTIHPTLDVSEEVSDAFFDEVTRVQLWDRLKFGRKERWILIAYTFLPAASYLPYAGYYENLKQRIVRTFLPATTFFQTMDATQPIRYIGLYNPYTPCGCPFSDLYYSNHLT